MISMVFIWKIKLEDGKSFVLKMWRASVFYIIAEIVCFM